MIFGGGYPAANWEHHRENQGTPEADTQAKEQGLGLPLPIVLRDYYKDFVDRMNVFSLGKGLIRLGVEGRQP